MDDEGWSSGLSGWTWHELGRQAEQAHQGRMAAASAFAARLRGEVPVDVGAVMAQNRALWQQNQALLQRIQELEASNRTWQEEYKALHDGALEIRDLLDTMDRGQAS